ncbi:MAG: prolipoprotein diacylglyceryl transferase family protein [Mycobacteriales bacterium]
MDTALSFPLIQRFVFIPPHGLFVAIGFLVGAMILMREVRSRDLSPDVVVNALTWGAFGSILGARADYVISHPDVFFGELGFIDSLVAIGKVWEGGLALFGGFIGGVLFALPTLIRARAHIPRLLDATVPGFAIGVAVGRIGDLIIGDHLGDAVTGSPWWKSLTYTIKAGTDLAPGFAPSPAVPGDCSIKGQFFADCSYHIPALYDLVGSLLIFLFLMWLRRRWAFRSGQLACVWAILYGTQRVLLDFTRSIDERPALGMTGTQLLGLLFATICTATLIRTWRRGYGVGDSRDDAPSREASLHRRAKPGDAAGGILLDEQLDERVDSDGDSVAEADDVAELELLDGVGEGEAGDELDRLTDDDLDDDELGDDEYDGQDSGAASDASSTPSAKPRA